jgi:hypothetical protein
MAALSSTQRALLANAGTSDDNSVGYNEMLAILQNDAVGGMTAAKFSALQTLASSLNTSGGMTASAYVQQITDDVVFGNSANAKWNGGSATASALGNLTATSSQTVVDELIGKWFLGTDLPSTSVAALGQSNMNPTYQPTTLPLYGASGSPSYKDVNQGYVGDCYFVAALGETALQDPSKIESMISSNGNGTYSVDFNINGAADYVTVNDELPTMASASYPNGSNLEFANGSVAWVGLIEKAYAELNEQTNVPHGGELNTAGNAYEDIAGGNQDGLIEITGQSVDTYTPTSAMSAAALKTLATTLGADFSAGGELLVATPGNSTGNLVSSHMFEVIGVNAATGTLTLQNPWNTANSDASIAMTFTETLAQLAAAACAVYATNGATA